MVRFAVAGCFVGLDGAVVASWLIQSQLHAIHSRDPITYGAARAAILCGAVIACWIPAHRITTISPLDALRTA